MLNEARLARLLMQLVGLDLLGQFSTGQSSVTGAVIWWITDICRKSHLFLPYGKAGQLRPYALAIKSDTTQTLIVR